jgi:hypothetical protein
MSKPTPNNLISSSPTNDAPSTASDDISQRLADVTIENETENGQEEDDTNSDAEEDDNGNDAGDAHGYLALNIEETFAEIDRIIKHGKSAEMVDLRKKSEVQYIIAMIDAFPAFQKRFPSLLKIISTGLDAAGQQRIATFLFTIKKMQQAPSDRAAKEIEWNHSMNFNRQMAPSLMNQLPADKLAEAKAKLVGSASSEPRQRR